MREKLIASFEYALAQTHPAALTAQHLPEQTPKLIIAIGKAALSMLQAALEHFPKVPFLAFPKDEGQPFAHIPGGKIHPSAHPVPDQRSLKAGERILEAVGELRPEDTLLLLVSGGGSSLVCAPWGIKLEEKQLLTAALLRSGADIHEMNAVRKHLSRIKGGRLAAATKARVHALYLSDVPGDDLSVVASGPTAPDASSFAEAIGVLDKYGLDFPKVRIHLQKGMEGKLPESPKPTDPLFERIYNQVIGSNQILLEAAQTYWQQQGYATAILSDRFQGDARELARFHAALVGSIRAGASAFKPPVVLLSGGEANVSVRGEGMGGRNQEFLAWLCFYLRDQGVWALAADSDGIDGNTPAAGALLCPDLWKNAQQQGLELAHFLSQNDSYGFFSALDGLLVTGGTANNLNDLRILVV